MEYARANEQPVSSFIEGQHNQGSMVASFCYALVKSKDHIIMVDVGYNYIGHNKHLADISGCSMWQPPTKILGKIGLSPDDIDTVFLTHAHFDHMGNIPSFKKAHFYIQEREINKWIWALSLPERFNWIKIPVNPQDIYDLCQLTNEGRLTLVDGHIENVLPGISLIPAYDTHSFGCQYIEVTNESGNWKGPWIFMGDNLFSYKNIELTEASNFYIPIGFCQCDKVKTLLSIDKAMEIVSGEKKRMILSHSTESWDIYPSWKGNDGLHVAEVCLAPGEKSSMPK
jgi:glyoxylase-like metal-dependent hydrolase (beta-lactamase superfamily II)